MQRPASERTFTVRKAPIASRTKPRQGRSWQNRPKSLHGEVDESDTGRAKVTREARESGPLFSAVSRGALSAPFRYR
jgi:hypothetical protein